MMQQCLILLICVFVSLKFCVQSVELRQSNELDPPSNLSVTVVSETKAIITWNLPPQDRFFTFKLKILPLPIDLKEEPLTIDNLETSFYILRNGTPGASYQIQVFTIFDGKESAEYASRKFTMHLNIPGKAIVWFRNETALLVLWQPLHPAGIRARYNVSISPPDATENFIYLLKERNSTSDPTQAIFKGLIPGRVYNISIQGTSEEEISISTTVKYRTIPSKPVNVQVEKNSVTTESFLVQWEPPIGKTDFDKYQIILYSGVELPPIMNLKEVPYHIFKDGLEPGKTYQVDVKTISADVSSWPVSVNVTLKPNKPGRSIVWFRNETTLIILCQPPPLAGTYTHYKVSIEPLDAEENVLIIEKTTDPIQASFNDLVPGRFYKIFVRTMSDDETSDPVIAEYRTLPLKPLNVSVDKSSATPHSFIVRWEPPNGKTDFEKYEISLNATKQQSAVIRLKEEAPFWEFKDNLEPGKTYQVTVKTISGKVTSNPVSVDVTIY